MATHWFDVASVLGNEALEVLEHSGRSEFDISASTVIRGVRNTIMVVAADGDYRKVFDGGQEPRVARVFVTRYDERGFLLGKPEEKAALYNVLARQSLEKFF